MSHGEYVPQCEQFELKLGMRKEEGLLTNFPRFYGERTTSTMFLQRCRKTYWMDIEFPHFTTGLQILDNYVFTKNSLQKPDLKIQNP